MEDSATVRMPFSKSSKVRLRLSSRPFEDCEPLLQVSPLAAGAAEPAKKVCHRLIWLITYLPPPASPFTSMRFSTGIKGRFKTEVDRESLVSAISKRVARSDRFRRTGKNVFALLTRPAQ